MSKGHKHFYEFGRFAVDTSNRLLLHDGEVVPLHPKAFEMLLLLVEHRGEVMEKDDLMQRLWPDSFVEDANLSQNIYVLRKTLGRETNGEEYIKTIPKRGYRFVADVKEIRNEETEFVLEEHTRTHVITEEEISDQDELRKLSPPATSAVVAGALETSGYPHSLDRLPATDLAASSRRPFDTRRWGKKHALITSVLLLAFVAAAYAMYAILVRKPAEPFQKMKITRLTDIGKAHHPAISADGKYLAYILRDDPGGQSIWVKHIPTGSATQIVPPAEGVVIESLTFSRDANFVYYGHSEKARIDLYQVPVLGGTPRKLIENIWGRVAPSPDGAQLAFLRTNWNQGEHMLIVAGIDGAGERVIATRKTPDFFNVFGVGPAWSPDGKLIAASGGISGESSGGGGYDDVIEVRVGDGSQRMMSGRKWGSVGQVAWLPDGSGLLIAAREPEAPTQQVWLLSYPEGSVQRVTNDLNYYERLGLTADGTKLVAEQSEHISNIWVSQKSGDVVPQPSGVEPAVSFSVGSQITTGKRGWDGFNGIAWSSDGKIIYSSRAGGSSELWITEPDGSGRRQLTVNGGGCAYPAVSPDGRYIVYSSDRSGRRNVWRVDIDGRNPRRLTEGSNEIHPSFTPDGNWVVYESGGWKTHLWKVSIEGGPPMLVTDQYSLGSPVVSPDGRLIAFVYYDEKNASPWRLGVISATAGDLIKSFPQPFRSFQWTPDGRSLTYISGTSTVSNIWSQPLDGSQPKQLTDFKEKRIYWFDWSRDGNWLALARGDSNYDIVMVSDFK